MDELDIGEDQNTIEDSENSDISNDNDDCFVNYRIGPKELSGKCQRHIAAMKKKSFSKTRWAYQYRANSVVRLTFASIVDALTSLSEEGENEVQKQKTCYKGVL